MDPEADRLELALADRLQARRHRGAGHAVEILRPLRELPPELARAREPDRDALDARLRRRRHADQVVVGDVGLEHEAALAGARAVAGGLRALMALEDRRLDRRERAVEVLARTRLRGVLAGRADAAGGVLLEAGPRERGAPPALPDREGDGDVTLRPG